MSRPICWVPLRFEVSVWRWSEGAALRECEALSARHLAGHALAPLAFERFQLWDLAGQALRMRRTYRDQARMLVGKLRYAWEARDLAAALQGYLDEAQHLVVMVRLRPELELAARARMQRRHAARKPRKGPTDEEIAAHHADFVKTRGTDRGWLKRAAIDLGLTERALRTRREKMRQ